MTREFLPPLLTALPLTCCSLLFRDPPPTSSTYNLCVDEGTPSSPLKPVGVNMEDTLLPNSPLLEPTGVNTEGYSSQEFVDRLDMVCYYTTAPPSQAEAPFRYWKIYHKAKISISSSTSCARYAVVIGYYPSRCT